MYRLFGGLALGALALVPFACAQQSSSPRPPADAQASATNAPCDPHHPPPRPFDDNNGVVPPPGEYAGPLFRLSHDYPTSVPEPNPKPWIQALNGQPIGKGNALAYVEALKAYVAADMRVLLFDYTNWDAAARGWYNEPWLACEREAIHGMYLGSHFPQTTFKTSSESMDTWVLTYYDAVAAQSLARVWGTTAMEPNLSDNRAQFDEGAVIVKVAVTTALADTWPPMAGASRWTLFLPIPVSNQAQVNGYRLTETSLLQIDVIVKDRVTAPRTGWVFATLVYDQRVSGDGWDKMVPLGAMWGNDPDVRSPTGALKETVINPAAPEYSTETLGWGGRLSGPNDGAVVAPAWIDGQNVLTQPASSCMSCHGASEWPRASFLLPSPSRTRPGDPTTQGDDLVLFTPGSPEWMQWFQDRDGKTPQDATTTALDYDMVYSFKSLPMWKRATQPTEDDHLHGRGRFHPRRRYAGR